MKQRLASSAKRATVAPTSATVPDPRVALHRRVGNRAMRQLLQRDHDPSSADAAEPTSTGASGPISLVTPLEDGAARITVRGIGASHGVEVGSPLWIEGTDLVPVVEKVRDDSIKAVVQGVGDDDAWTDADVVWDPTGERYPDSLREHDGPVAFDTAASAPQDRRLEGTLTGLYESDVAFGFAPDEHDQKERVMLALNQAGHSLSVHFARLLGRGSDDSRATVQRYEGTLHRTEDGAGFTGSVTSRSGKTRRMTLTPEGENQVAMELKGVRGGSLDLPRTHREPTLPAAVFATAEPEAGAALEAAELMPLTLLQVEALESLGELLERQVRFYLEADGSGNLGGDLKEDIAVNRIDAEFRKAFFDVVPAEQHGLALRQLEQQLLDRRVDHRGTSKPVWNWLVTIASTHKLDLADTLGVTDTSQLVGGGGYTYRWKMRVYGASLSVEAVGLGAYVGHIWIERQTGEGAFKRVGDYYTVLGEASSSGSLGAKGGFETDWTEFTSPIDLEASNLEGSYGIAGASASRGAEGTAAAGSFITFYGDGTFPPITAPASGEFLNFGLEAGLSLSSQFGTMTVSEAAAERNWVAARKQQDVEAAVQGGDMGSSHFEVGSAQLTAGGRRAVEDMGAVNLALLRLPSTSLEIIGMTSRTGDAERNRKLSELRAANTFQALQDALGPDLGVRREKLTIQGLGEEAAREAGMLDDSESEFFRRVDVKLDGRKVLVLR